MTIKNNTQMSVNRKFADVRLQAAVIRDVKQYSDQIRENLQAIADSLEFAPNVAPKYGVDQYAMVMAAYTIQVAKLHAFASGAFIESGIKFTLHKDRDQNGYRLSINYGVSFYGDSIEIKNGLPLFMAIRTVLKNQERTIGKVYAKRYTSFGDGVTFIPAKYYPDFILEVPSGITGIGEFNSFKAAAYNVANMSSDELLVHAYHVQLVLAWVSGTKYYTDWLAHELTVYQKLKGTMNYWGKMVEVTHKVGIIQDARPKKYVTIRSFMTNGEATGDIVWLPGTAADFEAYEALAEESCVSMIHW